MRLSSVFCICVSVLVFFTLWFVGHYAFGNSIKDCEDGVCDLLPAPPVVVVVKEKALKVFPNKPIRKAVKAVAKRVVQPLRVREVHRVREVRKVRSRWVHRPGRHGPRRLLYRLRSRGCHR